jgi:ABC-type multidrug transport system ATPase subunit
MQKAVEIKNLTKDYERFRVLKSFSFKYSRERFLV